jgi:hypothetical protein
MSFFAECPKKHSTKYLVLGKERNSGSVCHVGSLQAVQLLMLLQAEHRIIRPQHHHIPFSYFTLSDTSRLAKAFFYVSPC